MTDAIDDALKEGKLRFSLQVWAGCDVCGDTTAHVQVFENDTAYKFCTVHNAEFSKRYLAVSRPDGEKGRSE